MHLSAVNVSLRRLKIISVSQELKSTYQKFTNFRIFSIRNNVKNLVIITKM